MIRLSILKRNEVENQKLSGHGPLVKKLGIGAAGLLVFAIIFIVLTAFTSPDNYTKKDIGETYTVVESEGGTYFGPVFNEIYNGRGEFQHLDGNSYDGEFLQSKRSGKGTFQWVNGDRYNGTWSEDQMQKGTYIFADGCTYMGTFQNNQLQSGIFTIGNSAKGLGFETFTADIDDGKVSKVNFKLLNGTRYNGDVTGYAEIIYLTGNTYVGIVSQGIRNGTGTFKWMSGGKTVAFYVGEFSNDKMNGKGEYHYSSEEYPYISGTFINGKPDGKATYYKESSKKFTTTWKNGVCTGNNS